MVSLAILIVGYLCAVSVRLLKIVRLDLIISCFVVSLQMRMCVALQN